MVNVLPPETVLMIDRWQITRFLQVFRQQIPWTIILIILTLALYQYMCGRSNIVHCILHFRSQLNILARPSLWSGRFGFFVVVVVVFWDFFLFFNKSSLCQLPGPVEYEWHFWLVPTLWQFQRPRWRESIGCPRIPLRCLLYVFSSTFS